MIKMKSEDLLTHVGQSSLMIKMKSEDLLIHVGLVNNIVLIVLMINIQTSLPHLGKYTL